MFEFELDMGRKVDWDKKRRVDKVRQSASRPAAVSKVVTFDGAPPVKYGWWPGKYEGLTEAQSLARFGKRL